MKKAFSLIFVSFLCLVFLSAQSLVEMANKEKERREQLKGKNVKIITNADLKQMTKKPAVTVTSPGPGLPQSPGEQEASVPAETQEREAAESEVFYPSFAMSVLPETLYVDNPDLALYSPDGRFAEIAYYGILELEIEVKNGPGNDLAVYAQRPSDGIQPETMNYGVFVLAENGEWENIGIGGGLQSPETFELGNIRSSKRVMIVFKDYTDQMLAKPYILHSQEYSMGIDAVAALH